MYVLVTGPPASGKSTVAAPLAPQLGLPLLAKDVIKGGLREVLPADDVVASRQLGAAAVRALLALASANPTGAVLDSVWVHEDSVDWLQQLPGAVVEVFCRCGDDELRRRYRHRAESRVGDLDLQRTEAELWNERTLHPVGGEWPVLTLDTESMYDIEQVAERVRAAVRL